MLKRKQRKRQSKMTKKPNQTQLTEGWLTDLVSAIGSKAQRAAARSTASNAAARSAAVPARAPLVTFRVIVPDVASLIAFS